MSCPSIALAETEFSASDDRSSKPPAGSSEGGAAAALAAGAAPVVRGFPRRLGLRMTQCDDRGTPICCRLIGKRKGRQALADDLRRHMIIGRKRIEAAA